MPPTPDEIREVFAADYEPPSNGYLVRLREAPDRSVEAGRPHWSLSLASAATAVALVATLLGAVHLATSAAGTSPVPAGGPGGLPNAYPVLFVRPISSQEAWVVAGDDLWRTVDGGGHWTRVTPPGAVGKAISVQAVSRDEAWAVSSFASDEGQRSYVHHTIDGGQRWSRSQPLTGTAAAPQFADSRNGWLLSSAGFAAGSEGVVLYRTADGGETWMPAASSGETAAAGGAIPFGCHKTTLSFDDVRHGWIGGSCAGGMAVLYETADGGVTWRLQPLVAPDGSTLSGALTVDAPIFFTDTDAVLAVTDPSSGVLFYATADGGASWSLKADAPGATRPAVVGLRDWMVVSGGQLSATNDSGRSWSGLPRTLDLGAATVALVNPSSGWAWQPDALYRTADGGRTWIRVQPPPCTC